jgi:abequosyltransferase
VRISLCIPTYNREPELRELLASVARQKPHGLEVEVVISDNASKDDTSAVVDAFASSGIPVVYQRLPENIGFDRNILNVVSLATGDYCWLFGSDDILEDDAFARLEQVFARFPAPTGISVGSNGYAPDLSHRIPHRDHISTDFAGDTELHGRNAILEGIGPWGMGYISIIIVRREAWSRAAATLPIERFINGYIHAYLVAGLIAEDSTWVCVPDRIVGWRSGNESVVKHNEFTRTRLDIIGYDQAVGETLGRSSPGYHSIMRKVATFYIRAHFLTAKRHGAGLGYWKQAVPMALSYYWRYPSFWVRVLPIALLPRPLFLLLSKVLKAVFKRARPVAG